MSAQTLPELVPPTDLRYALERFTPTQAALYLSVDRRFIYRLVAAGKLSCLKCGRLKFSQKDLDEWRARNRIEARVEVKKPAPVMVPARSLRSVLPPTRRVHFG